MSDSRELTPGMVLEDTPDGPKLILQVVSPFGKTFAVLVPYQPVWVEIRGEEVLPVPESDIPYLETMRRQMEG